MAAHRGSSTKWFFSREQLEATPSRRCGVEPDRELSYRQQAANLIQDMGQRLNVSQLTINTAIVYMHRFYMYHSFTKFHRNIVSPTTLFLAAKVEEQPRKLEHVIKVAHACLNPQEPPLDTKMRASKDLAQTSYFMATNSLHLTTFCLQHRPTVIACVCIHLACKWSNWEIPVSTDGKHWWEYVDTSVTLELLDELTDEFLQILEKTPSKLKRIRNWRATQAAKKPKSDGATSESMSFPGPSLAIDQPPLDGISANATFSKPSTSFPMSLQGSALPLDHIGSTAQGTSYDFPEWPQDQTRSDSYLLKQLPLHLHRAEFPPVKHDHKAKFPPPSTAQPQKMSLEKYKEKHAAELAAQKHKQEHPSTESESRDSFAGSGGHAEPRKPQHPYTHAQQGSSGTSTSSPLKMKLPSSVQEKAHGDKREKGSSLKLRLPVQADRSAAGKEELKMKIKVSSDRHSSSDESAGKSKHSSPLVSKEKHRHHHKHSNPHGSALRSPIAPGCEGTQGSGSSRKRTHVDASHSHHPKKSKSVKPAAAGGLRPSQHAPESGQGVGREPWS